MRGTRVSIGVHIYSDLDRVPRTLAALSRHTRLSEVDVILFFDGVAGLPYNTGFVERSTSRPRGAAACFNDLANEDDSEYVVFLENGSIVTSGWLDKLIAAIEQDAANGLSGPSTNLIWNEQKITHPGDDSDEQIARTAAAVAAQLRGMTRSLAPLYSLADFCYVVHRKVICAIGGADLAYGLGPCWEMDFNIRAARGGFHGLWAQDAYVHRLPFSAHRSRLESELLEINRRVYQDRFCGARLRKEKPDYRAHCRGDACPNFAPPALLQVRVVTNSSPLVSCIMPTCDRRTFVQRALTFFNRQTYPNLELIVVDDGSDCVRDLCVDSPRVRYIRLEAKHTVGAKRNIACESARGQWIAHWDDDDWYSPERIARQVDALRSTAAVVCGTSKLYYYEPASRSCWLYEYKDRERPWIAGNTLLFRHDFWMNNLFLDVRTAEDTRFLWQANSGQILDMADTSLAVGVIHGGNTARKLYGDMWTREDLSSARDLLGHDLQLLDSSCPEVPVLPGLRSLKQPLISCIMPTADRPAFVSLALGLIAEQDYPNRELIIVDDGLHPVQDLVRSLPYVRYIRLNSRLTIGEKRNLACREAAGELIAHWDDDDWYAPSRLSRQSLVLREAGADLTGIVGDLMLVIPDGDFWTITGPLHERMFVGNVHGGTLMFRRSLLDQGIVYPPVNLAEDAALIRAATSGGKRLARLPNDDLFVYVRHSQNTWKFVTGRHIDRHSWMRTSGPSAFPCGLVERMRSAAASICQGNHVVEVYTRDTISGVHRIEAS